MQDDESFVSERIEKLVKSGVVPALVTMTKTESDNTKELLSRSVVF